MRISDKEIQKIIEGPTSPDIDQLSELGHDSEIQRASRDRALVDSVAANVMAMPDRQEVINALKARIDAGTYNPTSEEIVDGMVRRAIADHLG